MRHKYHVLRDDAGDPTQRVLSEAEKELLHLLKSRGVPSICESISKEINYVWAVTSGFRTLANVGNFYFACAGQTFGYNPAYDFFSSGGMQLAVFALHKFIHNETVLLPVLETIHIYTKLHVDGAVDFLAVRDAKEILMKCVRFHDNKHNVIAATCNALGSLVMNDLVKESIATPALTTELLGLLKRYATSLPICRAALVPLGFLVTDAAIAETFIDGNGIALVMTAMKSYVRDTEVAWHAIGILNAINAKVLDPRLIYAIYGFTGIPRIVEALASHLDTEEIAVEGFQLLSRLAALPDAYRIVNQCKVLDLAYVAQFAYSGPQHRHTRIEIKKTLHNFQKCTIYDAQELSTREQASRRDVTLYALFVLALLLTSLFSAYDTSCNAMATTLQRSLQQSVWSSTTTASMGHTRRERHVRKTLGDVSRVDDVWSYLNGPLHDTLFASTWYNGDAFADDVHSQLGVVGRSNVLLGGLQLRMLRVKQQTCAEVDGSGSGGNASDSVCFPPYSAEVEAKHAIPRVSDGRVERWSASDDSASLAKRFAGKLATYPDAGYRVFVPKLSKRNVDSNTNATCGPLCTLQRLRASKWIDASSRALFVEFTVLNAAEDVHCAVTLLFEFAATGGVLTTTRITPVKLNRYGGLFVFSLLFYAELLVLAGLCWHMNKQLDKLVRYRLYYFIVPSHVVDFLTVVLWLVAIVLRVQFHAAASHPLLVALAADDSFVDMSTIAYLLRQELAVVAWCAFLMWWRLLRLARCLKPLERTLEKFNRAEDLVESYVALLAIYVLLFAQTGFLLFPTSTQGFSSFGKSIASTSKALIRDWDSLDRGRSSAQDHHVTIWGVLFRLCSVFVTLNIVVAILRERFEFRLVDRQTVAVPDGLSILDLAKRQLKASGLPTDDVSLRQRLRMAASRGLDRLQHATRHAFAISDDPIELTELKTVWGLRSDDDDDDVDDGVRGDLATAARRSENVFDVVERLVGDAEDEDRMLDERLSRLRTRLQEAFQYLEIVERLRQERLEARLARSNRLRGIRLVTTSSSPSTST